jgi:hypothetical protein
LIKSDLRARGERRLIFVGKLHQIKACKRPFWRLELFACRVFSAGHIGTNRAFVWDSKEANCKQAIRVRIFVE